MKKILTILILISINLYPITQNEDGWTALMYASLFGYIEIVKELIKAGVDIKDRYGDTALDWAKDEGHNDIVELLRNSN